MKHYAYLKETPRWMIIILAIISVVAIFPMASLVISGCRTLRFGMQPGLSLAELGQLGDFFGGHTSAFAGSLSLIIILFFTFHQAKQQHAFFEEQQADTFKTEGRQFILDGINLITQWDIKSPGCDQCMRLLDFYSRLALESKDRELLLLLNTVITAKIRANLENKNGSFRATNYPYACEAVERIRPLREADGRALKMKKTKEPGRAENPSTP